MDRRIGRVEVGSLALVVGQLASPATGGMAVVAIVAVVALGAGLMRNRAGVSGAQGPMVVLLAFAVGGGLGLWGHRVPEAPDHVRALDLPWRGEVDAVVVDGPWRRGGRQRLTADVVATRRGGGWQPRRGRLAVSAYGALGSLESLEPGTRFQARMSIRAPRNFRNAGSFDWVGYLGRRGIHASGSLAAGTPVTVVTPGVGRWRGVVARWRRRVAARIESRLHGDARAVLLALVVGHRGDVSPTLRERFARAGVAHVLAISGLHVGIVAWVATHLLVLMLVRLPGLAARVAPDAVGRLVACAPVALYCALGGLGPSVLRAGVALGIVAIAGLTDRRPSGLRVVALVAVALSFLEPGLARDVGFQLSLAAVVGLVLGGVGRGGRIRRALGASFGAWVATAPLLAHHFQELSTVAPLIGPLLLPFFGMGPVAAGVVGAVAEPVSGATADASFMLGGALLRPGLWLVELAARVPGGHVWVPRPSAFEVAGMYVLLAGLATRRLRWRRWVVGVAVLAAIVDVGWWIRQRAHPGRLTVTFLDVGQGDASVVELPEGGVLVVDGGGLPGSSLDVGRAVVAPYLRARKITRVDIVVATHVHPDHFAGLVTVIGRFRPREVWWPGVGGDDEAWRHLEAVARAAGARVRVVAVGTTARLGSATVRVLHPEEGIRGSINDASVVLEVVWNRRRVLFTGDIERGAERSVLTGGLVGADVTVVKVPHHGSRTSSTPAFVETTAPDVAVISVGAANRYGHPSADVVARWRAAGACVLRTDLCGAVRTVIGRDASVAVTAIDARCACGHRSVRGTERAPS